MKTCMKCSVALAVLLVTSLPGYAGQVADVAASKHNLATGPVVTSSDTDRVCVFCHTPHGATADGGGFITPLWNRELSTQTYTLYDDTSIDSLKGSSLNATLEQPGGSSKLCLSCHDGTIAIGKVNVFNRVPTTLATTGTEADGTMPAGDGTTSGFTRDLGVSLQNDHPISFNYDSSLATVDGELHDPDSVSYIDNRVPGAPHPLVPLENGQVQCTSCHDPHVVDDSDPTQSVKFIRQGLNRFQQLSEPSSDTLFESGNDTLCLACHSKRGWSNSAHADSLVADETYTSTAAAQRDFPNGITVWQAACLNCHDTHTVQGARRLLREGTDDTNNPKLGGNPAQEETCYQCHDLAGSASNILTTTANQVPDIKSDFTLLPVHMPITNGGTEQQAVTEQHTILDRDFTESPAQLGKVDLTKRHAECTDCHNPHRVLKNRLFNDTSGTPDAAGTHDHNAAAGHSNLASGVLAGTTGVEPSYDADSWGQPDSSISYTLKQGVPGASTAASNSYVTREYQVCLKCHSNYAWPDGTPPTIGPSIGSNGVTQYTNQAMEFHPPAGDRGETPGATGVAANHSAWHPVIDSTGRSAALRGGLSTSNFLAPWSGAIGTQTMYCSDCHGSNVTAATSVEPDGGEDGNPWGPHGSDNPFILKGVWDSLQLPPASNTLCFKCHDQNAYSPAALPAAYPVSGFSCSVTGGCTGGGAGGGGGGGGAGCNMSANAANNLHLGHVEIMGQLRCTWCHVAVPHGWKNKALLVNLGLDEGVINVNQATGFDLGPYYQKAMLGSHATTGVNWRASGEWTAADCGGGGQGGGWMNNSCNAPP